MTFINLFCKHLVKLLGAGSQMFLAPAPVQVSLLHDGPTTVAAVEGMIRSQKRIVYAALHVNLSARHNCRSMRGRSNCTLSRLPRQLHVVSRRLCRRRCPHGDSMRMIVRAALLVVLHVAAAGCGDHAPQSRCACTPVSSHSMSENE